jgi:hypothetical protein
LFSNLKIWKSVPEKEYLIWIPELTSPMNIISYNNQSNNCFADLIETVVDTSLTPLDDGYIVKKPGIKISVFGQSEGSKVNSKNKIKF